MARLRFLYVIHTTADVTDADTDGNFELVVFSPVNPQAEIGEFGFPDRPHDERERGRTDRYRLNVSSLNMDMFHVRPEILAIRTGSDDAWLPSSIWVIAEDVQAPGSWRLPCQIGPAAYGGVHKSLKANPSAASSCP
jgi:hypothetical protein